MEKHEIIPCPRCQQLMECKVNCILKCECMDIFLTPNEQQFIQEQAGKELFVDCLCPKCLLELKKEYRLIKS